VKLAHDVDGSGPLLVAIHGITEDRTFWDRVPLAEHFRVVRVDLRGHGESERVAPFDPVTLAEDVRETLAEDEVPLLVGHSFGGVIASAYASRYPARGVIDVDQALQVSPLPAELAGTMRGAGFEEFFGGMFSGLYGELDPAVAEELGRRRRLRQDVVLGAWTPLLDLGPEELTAYMDALIPRDVPFLSLHGLPIDEGYAAWLHRRIPGALVETAPAVTHYPHLADPEWFVRRVRAFSEAVG
jgi:pimeloyl-ACP methyl ester carboxylesterase